MRKDKGASLRDRAVVNGAGQAVSALRASVPSAVRRCAGSYKRQQRAAVLRRDGPTCHYCGVETIAPRFNGDNADRVRTLDHIIPVSRGGSNKMDNLAIACGWCNRAKADGALDAQAIEARRAETGTDSVHESAVAESHAPDNPDQEHSHEQ